MLIHFRPGSSHKVFGERTFHDKLLMLPLRDALWRNKVAERQHYCSFRRWAAPQKNDAHAAEPQCLSGHGSVTRDRTGSTRFPQKTAPHQPLSQFPRRCNFCRFPLSAFCLPLCALPQITEMRYVCVLAPAAVPSWPLFLSTRTKLNLCRTSGSFRIRRILCPRHKRAMLPIRIALRAGQPAFEFNREFSRICTETAWSILWDTFIRKFYNP